MAGYGFDINEIKKVKKELKETGRMIDTFNSVITAVRNTMFENQLDKFLYENKISERKYKKYGYIVALVGFTCNLNRYFYYKKKFIFGIEGEKKEDSSYDFNVTYEDNLNINKTSDLYKSVKDLFDTIKNKVEPICNYMFKKTR